MDFGKLKERRLVQWCVAYVAGAWLVLQVVNTKDELFAWLERAYERRANQIVFAKVDPQLDSIRDDDRYRDLIDRIGL